MKVAQRRRRHCPGVQCPTRVRAVKPSHHLLLLWPVLCSVIDLVLKPGDRVRFLIGDVYLPESREVLEALSEDTEIVGTLTTFSDSGSDSGVFAVIALSGDLQVVVAVDKVRSVGSSPAEQPTE